MNPSCRAKSLPTSIWTFFNDIPQYYYICGMPHATTHTFIFTFFCKKFPIMLNMCHCEINSLLTSCYWLWFVLTIMCCSSIYIPTVVIIHNYITDTQLSLMGGEGTVSPFSKRSMWVINMNYWFTLANLFHLMLHHSLTKFNVWHLTYLPCHITCRKLLLQNEWWHCTNEITSVWGRAEY